MKVILIRDVARLGRRSEVKNVPDGHALNFLIPRKLAVIATPEAMKRLSEETQKHTAEHDRLVSEFSHMCAKLKDATVKYSADASEQGHLFKGINARDIAAHLTANEHVTIDENCILLSHPIKSLGTHHVELSFAGVKGACTLEVVKK